MEAASPPLDAAALARDRARELLGPVMGFVDQAQEDSTMDVATLAGLLHETGEHHDPYEQSAPEHNWWDWYAAYLNARLEGSDSDEATRAAGSYMAGVLGVR